DGVEHGAGAGHPVRVPRVLAHEERDLAVVEVAAGNAAHRLLAHPRPAGLLLGEGVRAELHAERAAGGRCVDPAQVIALSSPAVIEDALAALRVANRAWPGRDLPDGGVPIDDLEGAVGAPPQRVGEAVARVLVVVEPQGFLAVITLRGRGGAVTADALEAAAVRGHLDLDAAGDATQGARRGV